MLPDHCHRRIDVASAADVAAARDLAAGMSDGVLPAADAGRIDAVVAALATHALDRSGGMLLLRRWGRREGVECLAYDHDALADAGTETADVAAARSQADRFARHVLPGQGTTMLARVLRPGCSDAPAPGDTAVAGIVMVAKPGSAACGDGWVFRCAGAAPGEGSGVALVVDGVAGDEGAAALARRVEAVVAATAPGLSPQMVIGAIRRDAGHAFGQPSSGQSSSGQGDAGPAEGMTAAVLRFDAAAVDYTALGTVAGAVVRRHDLTSLAARWAMVGYNPQMPASVHLLWKPGDHVVLHSDGCARLPVLFIERGLHEVDPTLAAAVLLRDGPAQDDDRTIVVLRNIAVPSAISSEGSAGPL